MGGFLLFFFPDDQHHETRVPAPDFSSSPNLPSRRNNSGAAIPGKTQSTLLLCALLLFASLLFFTVSTFEPALPTSRGLLSGGDSFAGETALQRMGKLHLRGTRAVPDLLVCHVPEEDTSRDHFRVFLRVLFRSGFTSRADFILLFGSSSKFEGIIMEESESFLKLLERYSVEKWRMRKKADGLLGFDVGKFRAEGGEGAAVGEEEGQGSFNNDSESTRPSYGSVVSFQASELDPEDSLAGFVDNVPIGLRRWACYPMLLGRVRRNYNHVLLADAKAVLFLGDGKPRNFSSESVHVFRKPDGKHSNNMWHQFTRKRVSEQRKDLLVLLLPNSILRIGNHHSLNRVTISGGGGIRSVNSNHQGRRGYNIINMVKQIKSAEQSR